MHKSFQRPGLSEVAFIDAIMFLLHYIHLGMFLLRRWSFFHDHPFTFLIQVIGSKKTAPPPPNNPHMLASRNNIATYVYRAVLENGRWMHYWSYWCGCPMFGCLLFFQQGWLMNTKECAVFHSKYKESAASFPQASEEQGKLPQTVIFNRTISTVLVSAASKVMFRLKPFHTSSSHSPPLCKVQHLSN